MRRALPLVRKTKFRVQQPQIDSSHKCTLCNVMLTEQRLRFDLKSVEALNTRPSHASWHQVSSLESSLFTSTSFKRGVSAFSHWSANYQQQKVCASTHQSYVFSFSSHKSYKEQIFGSRERKWQRRSEGADKCLSIYK